MKTWVKLYTEILRDPDQGTLTWAQRGIWSALLALAGELDHRDADDQPTGQLDTALRVAWHLRCTLPELEDALAAFEERGMIVIDDGVIYLPHFPDRQAQPASESNEQVRQRVARYRKTKRACNEDVTTLHVERNEPVTILEEKRRDTDPDTEKRQDAERASAQTPAAPAPEPIRSLDLDTERIAGIFRVWQDTVGRNLTQTDRDRFEGYLEDYGVERLEYAVRQCFKHHKCTHAYLQAVLSGNGHGSHAPPGRRREDVPSAPGGFVMTDELAEINRLSGIGGG